MALVKLNKAIQQPLGSRQNGVALITVLLVLALATVTIVSMSSERQTDIRRTENLMRSDQTWLFAQSLEAAASQRLHENDGTLLNNPLYATEIGGTQIQATLQEQQGKLNLNNLIHDAKLSEVDVLRFKRLLNYLGLNPELTDALLDWMDQDSLIRYPLGAEDEAYGKANPPYRAANRQLADVSELLLVQGFTRKIYERLLPFIYVAPGYAALNVNTASSQLLRCLADDISQDQAESMFRAAGKPFKDVNEFLQDEAVANLGITQQGLTVNSHYFLLSGTINMGRVHLQFESQLHRQKEGEVQVIRRTRTWWQHG